MRPLILLLLLALPARADERPSTTPTRDVDIVYRIGGGLEQRMRWGVALGKLRVDPPSPGLYMVIDTASRSIAMVREGERSVLRIAGAAKLPGPATATRFTRKGSGQIAGLTCTNWDTTDAQGSPTTTCLTHDGVLLRAANPDGVLLEASSVSYIPQGEAVFRLPQDYKVIEAPALSRQGG
jgi:hypothetical protein